MADFTDVELRIRGETAPGLRAVEVRVDRSGCWSGQSKFSFDTLDPSDPPGYGLALGQQLANPGLIRALDQAGLTRGGNIRLRLWLDEESTDLQTQRWERLVLTISGADRRLATSPNIALSRYIPVELPDGNPPESVFFCLLIAVANPIGLSPSQEIDVEGELDNFVKEFESTPSDRRLQVTVLPGRTGIGGALQARISNLGWKTISGNSTLQGISDELHKHYHGLHILGHGDFDPQTSVGALLLESDTGGQAKALDSELESWLTSELQLIVFQACLSAGAPAANKPPFTGLAPHLIRLGLPASVAMQDLVAMEDARTFFSEFYRSLLDDGLVDVAVNRGRQRLIKTADSDNWSIPALFTRLRGGRLWRSDPIRQSILDALGNLPASGSDKWPAIQAIEHTRGVTDYNPLLGASGPCYDLWGQIRQLAARPGEFIILTGATGSSKAAQVTRLFRDAGEQFRQAKTTVLPIYVSLLDLAAGANDSWPALDRVWSGQARQPDLDQVEGRNFLFLIGAEEEVDGPMREQALAAIKRLRNLPGSRLIIVADEVLLPALSDFEDARLLVAQPLDQARILAYLKALGTKEADAVRQELLAHGRWGLASQPRFLQHLLDLSQAGASLTSRRVILERISRTYLARTDTRRIPRNCVEDAACRIAWEIQNRTDGELDGAQFYALLQVARAGREFPLSELRRALIEECGILTPNGPEGVRFVYAIMQSYFAACYLYSSPNLPHLLDEITASLGRLSRLRRWEEVLVTLAGMLASPAVLLRSVLAGSSFMEGEQLFLAARCYREVGDADDKQDLADVVDQMVDSLLWRSSWDPLRPYGDRRVALRHLIEMAVACDRLLDDIVPHLIALAFDRHQATADSLPSFDWSGIRQTAAQGLIRLGAHVTAHRPDLAEMIDAWAQLADHPERMREILFRDDPSRSVVAAFAIAHGRRDGAVLLDAYRQSKNDDVKWGIVDAISEFDVSWIQQNVVDPWMETTPVRDSPGPKANADVALRSAHICYLLQKTQFASAKSRAYLADCLQLNVPLPKSRALRACAKLHDPEIEAWLVPMCEAILLRRWDQIDTSRIRLDATQAGDQRFQRSALEILRDIGNANSLQAVRKMRPQFGNNELRLLSFQVAEEMYWRLSGGLNRESLDATAFHRAAKGE